MSKFHNYSFNNTVLIALQKPDASLVMGFNAWKGKGIERNVKKGEQGIRIFAPAPYKIKTEAEKLDPDTKKPIIGEDGKPITETKEITIPAFKVVCVYDVSQTEGKELPTLGAPELLGSVENYKDFFAASFFPLFPQKHVLTPCTFPILMLYFIRLRTFAVRMLVPPNGGGCAVWPKGWKKQGGYPKWQLSL